MDTQSQASARSNATTKSQQTKSQRVKKVVNMIFAANGVAPVKTLSSDFADGTKFVTLFNILFDEHVDLKLSTEGTNENRVLNWNKINATICFNYLQQQFILIGSTMKALAAGKK